MTGGRKKFIEEMEGEKHFYWDWRERNRYTGTVERGTYIMGPEGDEHIYWDLRERKSYIETGGRCSVIPGL